jgi:dTDP-4-dehydrorhamnose 3,5-epimerase
LQATDRPHARSGGAVDILFNLGINGRRVSPERVASRTFVMEYVSSLHLQGCAVKVVTFDIEGPLVFEPAAFRDDRGYVSEIFNARRFEPYIGSVNFVQTNYSLSHEAGTLRGLHFQKPPVAQGKLVRVVKGAVYGVGVDVRTGSPTFGRHVAVELRAAKLQQFWVPIGFAHGFLTLEPETEVEYFLTAYYTPDHNSGIAWNDPTLAIGWPKIAGGPVLSPQDKAQPDFLSMPQYFRWQSAAALAKK